MLLTNYNPQYYDPRFVCSCVELQESLEEAVNSASHIPFTMKPIDAWIFWLVLEGLFYYYWIIENLVKMAKYHCWPKYLTISYYFGNIYEWTILLELEFFEKIFFKFVMLFFVELEFLELKLHKKLVAIFHGTWVPKIRVTWQTQVSQTRVSKKW